MLDFAAGGLVVVMALLGYQRGLVSETLGLLSWVAATAFSYAMFPLFQPVMQAVVRTDYVADGLAVAAPFVVLLLPLLWVTRLVSQGTRHSSLNAVDRVIGLAFGAIRAVYILCLSLMTLAHAIPVKNQAPWLRDSQARAFATDYGTVALKALVGPAVIDGVMAKFDAAVVKAQKTARQPAAP